MLAPVSSMEFEIRKSPNLKSRFRENDNVL